MKSIIEYIKILDVPNVNQTKDFSCGASAVKAILKYYNINISEKDLINDLNTNSKNGTSINNIVNILKKYDLQSTIKTMSIQDLKDCVDKKIPVIIPIQAWPDKEKDYKNMWDEGHYVVVIGYDKDHIYFEDPALSKSKAYLTFKELEEQWHDKSGSTKYIKTGIIVSK